MKTRSFILGIFFMSCSVLLAQRQNKIGYIDMDYILQSIPEYEDANAQLNVKVGKWKKEIDARRRKIKDLKEELKNERPFLTQDLIDEQQEEIDFQQKDLQQYQEDHFGAEGKMVEQRKQIAQPIQDEVFNAVQEIGVDREYDFIFESSSEALMLFSAKRHDISEQVLNKINRNTNLKKRETASRGSEEEREVSEEEGYKSVEQARLDKEKTDERAVEKKERKMTADRKIEERRKRRDSIMEARRSQQKIRRDSIKRARAEMMEDRKRARDSVKMKG